LISSFLKPHDPFMPVKRFADMFRPEDMHLPRSFGKADRSRLPKEVVRAIENNAVSPEFHDANQALKHVAFYYANLAQMDDCLGKITGAVREMELENDTIICYTSDHGEMLGDLGLWQKFQFYEGSCGVPLMFRVPGRSPGVCPAPVSLVSLSATLTDLAGVPQAAPNDSFSLRPWIADPQLSKDPGPVFAEYALGGRNAKTMIRDGQWKYTIWANDIPELYGLKSDPDELRNLAGVAEYAAKEAELRSRLLAFNPIAK
jgi:choline-sulfatase